MARSKTTGHTIATPTRSALVVPAGPDASTQQTVAAPTEIPISACAAAVRSPGRRTDHETYRVGRTTTFIVAPGMAGIKALGSMAKIISRILSALSKQHAKLSNADT